MRLKREWSKSKEDQGVGNTIQEDFKIILFNNITNIPNWRLDAANKYKIIKQCLGQLVGDFVSYLNILKRELEIYNNQIRAYTLFGKFNRDLKA